MLFVGMTLIVLRFGLGFGDGRVANLRKWLSSRLFAECNSALQALLHSLWGEDCLPPSLFVMFVDHKCFCIRVALSGQRSLNWEDCLISSGAFWRSASSKSKRVLKNWSAVSVSRKIRVKPRSDAC